MIARVRRTPVSPGDGAGWRSHTVMAALVMLSGAWLTWPVWDSATVPTLEQLRVEAPWLLAAQVCGLTALAVAIWTESGRRFEVLRAVTALSLVDVAIRALVNPSVPGVELVHALPLVAGAALGAPAGFLTGAGACLASTLFSATPAETLPSQMLVWGLFGACGGVAQRLRPRLAWPTLVVLAIPLGVLSGVLLNLMGWAQQPGTTTSHFVAGLPPGEVVSRLWSHSRQTSWGVDVTRGVCTALVVLLIGLPVLRALRLRGEPLRALPPEAPISAHALARRRHAARFRPDDLPLPDLEENA